MEIKAKALKNFWLKTGKRVRKNQTIKLSDLERAENLENRKLVKIVSVTAKKWHSFDVEKKDYSKHTFKELKEMFPSLKAKTKKEFLKLI